MKSYKDLIYKAFTLSILPQKWGVNIPNIPNIPDASTIERIEVLCYGRSDPSGIFNKPPQAQRRIVLSSQISN